MQPRRKVARKNRRTGRKGPSNVALNNKIKKINKNIELKKCDVIQASTVISNTGSSLSTLTNIIQGTGEFENRIGTQINPTSIQIRCNFLSNTAILNASRVRMMVFWDRQSNGAVSPLTSAGISSLLDNSIITDLTMSPLNYDDIQRFTVLYDKVWNLNPQVSTSATTLIPMSKFMKKKLKLSRLVKFTGAGPVIPYTNSLVIAWFANNNGGSSALLPTVECGARVYYRDA